MKILQICNKVPFPPTDGGCIAMNNLTQGLLKLGHSVKVLAITTPKHNVNTAELPEAYKVKTGIETFFIDTSVKPVPALLNIFSKDSYNIVRFYSKAFEEKLIGILQQENFDIVQLESLYVSMYAPAIRKHSKAKVVFRAHNIEHQLWQRNAANADNLAERLYFNFLAKRLKTYEEQSLQHLDAVAAITGEDAAWFIKQAPQLPVEVVPFGIDLDNMKLTSQVETEPLSVFHLGAMDWQPNMEGIQWFIDKVWDKVQVNHPHLKLYLAGRKMGIAFKVVNKPNVVVVGEVENAYDFMSSKGLMLVPLLSGGGMRVKIIEGMALGKVIVTTSIGAEGIALKSGENAIIANDADSFVEAISKYLSAPDLLVKLGENAKSLALSDYNNTDICKRLTQLYQQLIKHN